MPSDIFIIFLRTLTSFAKILSAFFLETHSCALELSLISLISVLFNMYLYITIHHYYH